MYPWPSRVQAKERTQGLSREGWRPSAEATGKLEAVTKLQVLAEQIVEDAIAGCIASRKKLVDRLYPMLNLHEIAGADGGVLQVEIEAAAQELD